MKLRTKIQLIFGIMIFILLGVLGATATASMYNVTTSQVNDNMRSSVRLAADDISNQLNNYRKNENSGNGLNELKNKEFLNNILKKIIISENSYAYIISSNGDVIAHTNNDDISAYNILKIDNKELKSIAQDIISGNEGNGTYKYNGMGIICSYTGITGSDGWSIVIAAPKKDFYMNINKFVMIIIVIEVVAFIAAMAIAVSLAGYISKSVVSVEKVLVAISKGDISKKIDKTNRKDEIGVLQNAAASLCDTLSDIISESNYALSQIANYNLSFSKMKEYPGQFNTLAVSVNSISDMLKNLIMSIQQSSSEVASGSRQLEEAAEMLSQGTVSQAEAISGLVTDVSNITERINSNSENGEVINKRLLNLDSEIQRGNIQMTELIQAMDDIEKMSSDIQKIVGTIDGIAFQTNILSLNASVEAARAGKNGKGFAVVAEEVGKLAQKSEESSTQTADLIEQCIKAINVAKEKADNTFKSLSSIVADSSEISKAFDDISKDTIEQARSSGAINTRINEISDVVQSNTATAQQTAASTEELSQQAVSMSQLISRFRVK